MQELKYINSRGDEILFSNYAPYIFWKIDGIGVSDAEANYTQAPLQYGYTLNNILLNERVITFFAHIDGSRVDEMYRLRQHCSRVFSNTLGLGKLIYSNDYGTYEIMGFCRNYNILEKYDTYGIQTLQLEFECPFPFFSDTEEKGLILNYVEGGLEFPLETPTEFGIFGYYVDVDVKTDCPCHIKMLVDGGAKVPIITNTTTGEFIKIEKFINPHEKLFINTDPQNIEVSILRIDPETNKQVKENAYGYLSYDSTLFKLIDGVNSLSFSSNDEENKKVRIKIYYKQYYGGV